MPMSVCKTVIVHFIQKVWKKPENKISQMVMIQNQTQSHNGFVLQQTQSESSTPENKNKT